MKYFAMVMDPPEMEATRFHGGGRPGHLPCPHEFPEVRHRPRAASHLHQAPHDPPYHLVEKPVGLDAEDPLAPTLRPLRPGYHPHGSLRASSRRSERDEVVTPDESSRGLLHGRHVERRAAQRNERMQVRGHDVREEQAISVLLGNDRTARIQSPGKLRCPEGPPRPRGE